MGEVGSVKSIQAHHQYVITDRSKAIYMMWFSITCFGVGCGGVSPCVCTDYFRFFSSLLNGHLLGKSFLSVDPLFSLYIVYL